MIIVVGRDSEIVTGADHSTRSVLLEIETLPAGDCIGRSTNSGCGFGGITTAARAILLAGGIGGRDTGT